MARREDTSDALEQRWAEHWPMAMGLGIDEANESIYPAHFERNSELADTFDGRAQILDRGLALQAKWWRRVTGRCAPEHPDFVLEVGGELDGDALALHRKAETYARTHEMGYAEAYIRSPRVGSRSTRRVPHEGRPHNRTVAWPPASAIVADTARGPLSLDPNAHHRGAPARRPSAPQAAHAVRMALDAEPGRWGRSRPTSETVKRVFGSFNQGLTAAGLEVRPPNNGPQERCKRGHALTPENVYPHHRGGRMCLTCMRERQPATRAPRARQGEGARADARAAPGAAPGA